MSLPPFSGAKRVRWIGMNFSRDFKAKTWFVKMPNGAIEVHDGRVVERAFLARMLDGQTPIRAVGTHVWDTLDEATGVPSDDGFTLRGVARFDPNTISDVAWGSGADIDARKLGSRGQRKAALLSLALLAGLFVLLGTELSAALTNASSRTQRTVVTGSSPTILETNDAKLAHPTSKLSPVQRERLKEHDATRDLSVEKERVRRLFATKKL